MYIQTQTNIPIVTEELGRRLRALRLQQNLTRQIVAARSGVSLKTIARAEEGENISLETFLRILKTLSVLENMEQVLPNEEPLPTDILKETAHIRRQRASSRKTLPKNNDWKWGDEE